MITAVLGIILGLVLMLLFRGCGTNEKIIQMDCSLCDQCADYVDCAQLDFLELPAQEQSRILRASDGRVEILSKYIEVNDVLMRDSLENAYQDRIEKMRRFWTDYVLEREDELIEVISQLKAGQEVVVERKRLELFDYYVRDTTEIYDFYAKITTEGEALYNPLSYKINCRSPKLTNTIVKKEFVKRKNEVILTGGYLLGTDLQEPGVGLMYRRGIFVVGSDYYWNPGWLSIKGGISIRF